MSRVIGHCWTDEFFISRQEDIIRFHSLNGFNEFFLYGNIGADFDRQKQRIENQQCKEFHKSNLFLMHSLILIEIYLKMNNPSDFQEDLRHVDQCLFVKFHFSCNQS